VDGKGGGAAGIRAQRVDADPDDVALGDEEVAGLCVEAGEGEGAFVEAVGATEGEVAGGPARRPPGVLRR